MFFPSILLLFMFNYEKEKADFFFFFGWFCFDVYSSQKDVM